MVLGRRNVLVIGSGGREHVVGWKLNKSPDVGKVYHATGNGGTSNNLGVTDFKKLIRFAENNDCMTIVGPEGPLEKGIVNAFRAAGLPIFGPTREAARLEWSKVFAKEFMMGNGILTPRSEVFDDPHGAIEYVRTRSEIVIKADGLAGGKGVVVCDGPREAMKAINEMMIQRKFGRAADRILAEARLHGTEVSYMVITDGKNYFPLATSQDYKRLEDGDKGKNTGGMGSYSPSPIITSLLESEIRSRIVEPTITGMAKAGIPVSGILYFGLMLTTSGINLLEINTRFGDPETAVLLTRLESDLFPYLESTTAGRLGDMIEPRWSPKSSVTVVMAAKGYSETEKCVKGVEIRGLGGDDHESMIFHAGTKRKRSKIVTNGGRILEVTALGETLEQAALNAYKRVEKVTCDELVWRHDIASDGIALLRTLPATPPAYEANSADAAIA